MCVCGGAAVASPSHTRTHSRRVAGFRYSLPAYFYQHHVQHVDELFSDVPAEQRAKWIRKVEAELEPQQKFDL